MELLEIFEDIKENYYNERLKSPFSKNSLATQIKHGARDAFPEYLLNRAQYEVKGSPGKGRWAIIPWIGIFDKGISVTAQKGMSFVTFAINIMRYLK